MLKITKITAYQEFSDILGTKNLAKLGSKEQLDFVLEAHDWLDIVFEVEYQLGDDVEGFFNRKASIDKDAWNRYFKESSNRYFKESSDDILYDYPAPALIPHEYKEALESSQQEADEFLEYYNTSIKNLVDEMINSKIGYYYGALIEFLEGQELQITTMSPMELKKYNHPTEFSVLSAKERARLEEAISEIL